MLLLQQTEKVQLVKCVARTGNLQITAAWKKLSCWIFLFYFFLQSSLLQKSCAPKAERSDLTRHLYHTRISLSTTVTSKSQQLADFDCFAVSLSILPDGGGDTDSRPGSGSVRGVATGTHHCRMAQ